MAEASQLMVVREETLLLLDKQLLVEALVAVDKSILLLMDLEALAVELVDLEDPRLEILVPQVLVQLDREQTEEAQ
jgi:hypothetical protein